MSAVWAVMRRELSSLFVSPVAYVVLCFFAFIYGYFFNYYLNGFIEMSMRMSQMGGNQTLNLNQDLIRWLLHTTGVVVLFLLPMLTMRTFSEELRSGTIELLLTSPVRDVQLVLGKFLATLTLYAAMLGLTWIHMGFLFYFGEPELKPLLVGYLGMLLLGACYLAVGIFFSTLTRNQVIAGFAAFGTFLLLWLVEDADSWFGATGTVLSYLSVTKHLDGFSKGVIDSRDLVYYVSFILMGLFLSTQSLQTHRWRG